MNIRDEMELMGPVRITKVEQAHKELMANVARAIKRKR